MLRSVPCGTCILTFYTLFGYLNTSYLRSNLSSCMNAHAIVAKMKSHAPCSSILFSSSRYRSFWHRQYCVFVIFYVYKFCSANLTSIIFFMLKLFPYSVAFHRSYTLFNVAYIHLCRAVEGRTFLPPVWSKRYHSGLICLPNFELDTKPNSTVYHLHLYNAVKLVFLTNRAFSKLKLELLATSQYLLAGLYLVELSHDVKSSLMTRSSRLREHLTGSRTVMLACWSPLPLCCSRLSTENLCSDFVTGGGVVWDFCKPRSHISDTTLKGWGRLTLESLVLPDSTSCDIFSKISVSI
jgi:hypothetical protein